MSNFTDLEHQLYLVSVHGDPRRLVCDIAGEASLTITMLRQALEHITRLDGRHDLPDAQKIANEALR